MSEFKAFLKEEDGMGVVEVILIIVVLISLVALFKSQIKGLVNDILDKLLQQTGDLLNDMGTILIGQEAVDVGLIEEVGGITDALKKLNSMIKDRENEKENKASEENKKDK